MPKRRIQNTGQTDTIALSSPPTVSGHLVPDDTSDPGRNTFSKLSSSPDLTLNISAASTGISTPKPMVSAFPLRQLGLAFFDQPCIDLAKSLLGKVLVRKMTAAGSTTSILLTARIVETESYLGGEDRASHSFNGKKTNRNAAMFMSPGTCYVYLTYGMYECFNISSQGEGAAVLIRSAEPLTGIDHMRELRRKSQKTKKPKIDIADTVDSVTPTPTDKVFKVTDICGGPSKLCMAMGITRQQFNQVDLTRCEEFYVADDGYGAVEESDIVSCARIGINNAGEWNTKPLRFYIRSSNYVSVKVKGQ